MISASQHSLRSRSRRGLVLVLLVLLVLLGQPSAAHAAPPPIETKVTLSAEHVTLGERLRLLVIAQHPSDVVVSLQPITRTSTLQVVEVRPPTDTLAGAATTTWFEVVLAAFSLGPFELDPLQLAWLRADGESGEIELAPPTFAVRATVAPNDRSMRPLKPTLEIAGGPPLWQGRAIAGGGAAGALLLLLGAALILRARWPTAPPASAAVDTPPSIEDAARARLDEMAAAEPLARHDYDEYYGTISTVVRDYLQQRFEFGARALTTPELQRRMVGRGVERWQARLVGGLLDRCDSAVYAGRHPDPASADHDLTVAFEIIELSRPIEQPAMPEPAATGARR